MNSSDKPYILLIGGQKVGKTSIMERLINNKFNTKVEPTFGPDLYRYSVNDNKLNVIEIGGQLKCCHIVQSYCDLAHTFLVVYDITNYKSFLIAIYWIHYIRKQLLSDNKVVIVLVGNKVDSQSDRVINANLVQQYANDNNFQYIETSALSDFNLTQIFEEKALTRSLTH